MTASKFLSTCSLITSVILIVAFFVTTIKYRPSEITRPEYVNETIYLDKSFNKDEVDIIIQATWEWSKATENRVIYKVIQLNEHNNNVSMKNSILVNKFPADNIQILTLDYISNNTVLGYYSNEHVVPNIGIVAERLENAALYKEVVMHELGHSLGLEHDESDHGIGTLMYPSVELQSENITKADIEHYCEVHNCSKRSKN